MNYNIGVIGKGFVGTAIVKGFAQFADVKTYDIDPKKSSHSFEEVINCNFVFLCLPTPMLDANGDKANLAILEDCVDKISRAKDGNKLSIYILKSTVPVGTTEDLSRKYKNMEFVHSPEFLTARSALIDFICPARNIVGYVNVEVGKKVQKLLQDRFPGTPCFFMKSKESEMVKYIANCFFATKVIFFNEAKLLVEKEELDWDKILEGVMSDGRIGTSHYQVPGHDGDRGFGGTCFPKDINALIYMMEQNGIDPLVLKAVWEQNKKVRENWDWADNKSAVYKGEKNV